MAQNPFSIAYQARVTFIKDSRRDSTRQRKRKKVFRRFGMIVRQQGRKNIRKGPIERLKATTRSGKTVTGETALFMIRSGQAVAENTISYSAEPNLRSIFYSVTKGSKDVLIGPVGFGSANPLPEKIEDERPFMAPALESRYHELAKSVEMFGLV